MSQPERHTIGGKHVVPLWNHKICHNGFVNLTLKNIPEDVYAKIKAASAANGRSLNSEIIQILIREAEENDRRRQRAAWSAKVAAFARTLPKTPDSVPIIREDRDR